MSIEYPLHADFKLLFYGVRFVDIYIPGGHEDYMADLAKLFENNGRPQKEDFTLLEQKHDIVYFWNKLPDIMSKYKVHL